MLRLNTRFTPSRGGLWLLWLALFAAPAQAVWLESVIAEPGAEEFLISLDGPAEYRYFVLETPPRLVVDIIDARPVRGLPLSVPTQGPVERIRHARRPDGKYRVVFDLSEMRKPNILVETPDGSGRGHGLHVRLLDPQAPVVVRTAAAAQPGTAPPVAGQPVAPVAGQAAAQPEPEPEPEPQAPAAAVVSVPEPEQSPSEEYTGWNPKSRWSGYLALEGRGFAQSPMDSRQHDGNLSLAFEPEYYLSWDSGYQSLTIKPFIRMEQGDSERSHWDIREFMWIKAGNRWEVRAGIGKVFWGVTEAYHLVDVINQTDLVENVDGEQKLGQPMLKFSTEQSIGTLDFYLLPYFRERTFPGREGRPRTHPWVEMDMARYESDRDEGHLDFALRWYRSVGDWDIGLAHFRGTSRDPRLVPGMNGNGEAVLIPYYDIIRQTSLDLQATKGDWLWKLEALHRAGQGDDDYWAATGGFEYTLVGVADTAADLGLLLEYMRDDRGKQADQPYQNDLFAGVRWVLNDVDSSEVLAGLIFDMDYGSRMLNIEASRRMGQNWKLTLQARAWYDTDTREPLYPVSRDDYAELVLYRYF